MRGSPRLPFRGMIGYYGHVFRPSSQSSVVHPHSGFGLQYWNAVDSSLSYVPLGDDQPICGPGWMYATADGIEVQYVDWRRNDMTVIRVPWGDDAYPMFIWSIDPYDDPGTPVMQVGENLHVEQADAGVFEISTPRTRRYYRLDYNGLHSLDSDYESPELDQEHIDAWSTREMAGTDGRRYGLRIIPHEPACGPQLSLLFSGATGELIACGWSYLGPVLVNLDESYRGIESPVLPAPYASGSEECDRVVGVVDLRNLSKGSAEASGERA